MTSFDNTQYASALRGTRTAAPESAEFANGPIDSQGSEITTGNIEYVRFAGVRDRIYTDKATTSGNILMLCPTNCQGIAQGMAAEIATRHSDAWNYYADACKAGTIGEGDVILVQAASRQRTTDGRNSIVFKDGQMVMSRLIIGFVPVKDRFGSRNEPSAATIEFADLALQKLAGAALSGYLHELGITEIRTPKLVTGQPWKHVARVMLEELGATDLPTRIHLSAEDVEYDLTTDGEVIDRAAPSVAQSSRVIARF